MIRHHFPSPAGARRRVGGNESGAALVEFSLVAGLFAFILYGLVTFGSALATKQRVTSAVADGARAAVGADSFGTAKAKAEERVVSKLGTTGYTATYLPETASCASPAQCIRVTVVYDLPASPGLGLVTSPTTSSTAVVQYR